MEFFLLFFFLVALICIVTIPIQLFLSRTCDKEIGVIVPALLGALTWCASAFCIFSYIVADSGASSSSMMPTDWSLGSLFLLGIFVLSFLISIIVYGSWSGYGEPSLGEGTKNKATLWALFFGFLGAHKFYLGFKIQGMLMLAFFVLTFGVGSIVVAFIAIYESLLYLLMTDQEFEEKYITNKK